MGLMGMIKEGKGRSEGVSGNTLNYILYWYENILM